MLKWNKSSYVGSGTGVLAIAAVKLVRNPQLQLTMMNGATITAGKLQVEFVDKEVDVKLGEIKDMPE